MPKEISKQMKFYFAKTYDDVKKIVFKDEKKAKKVVTKKVAKKVSEKKENKVI